MPGRAVVVKRAPVVEKVRPPKPWDVMLRDIWRKNTFACVALAVIAVSCLGIMVFNRNAYIKSWAYSQGFKYSGNYDYKLHKRLLYFDAVSRGQKSYAFNVMKGNIDFTNKTVDAVEQTGVQAFDFCYTEVKQIQQNKRIHRMEKNIEFSAIVFDASGYTFKSMIVTPRDMQVDSDMGDLPVQQADADTEELMKGPTKDKDADDSEGKDAGNGTNETAAANITEEKPAADAPKVAAEAVENGTASNETDTETDTELAGFSNKTNPLSMQFNDTFKVEAADHTQADQMLSPTLKQLLLDHPKFFVDFEEDQIMVYREYTIEASEYSEAISLGKQLLAHLPHMLSVEKKVEDPEAAKNKPKKAEESSDVSVFVSRTEL